MAYFQLLETEAVGACLIVGLWSFLEVRCLQKLQNRLQCVENAINQELAYLGVGLGESPRATAIRAERVSVDCPFRRTTAAKTARLNYRWP